MQKKCQLKVAKKIFFDSEGEISCKKHFHLKRDKKYLAWTEVGGLRYTMFKITAGGEKTYALIGKTLSKQKDVHFLLAEFTDKDILALFSQHSLKIDFIPINAMLEKLLGVLLINYPLMKDKEYFSKYIRDNYNANHPTVRE